jgi:hypothetical protein
MQDMKVVAETPHSPPLDVQVAPTFAFPIAAENDKNKN